jgi:hypothetical protein
MSSMGVTLICGAGPEMERVRGRTVLPVPFAVLANRSRSE